MKILITLDDGETKVFSNVKQISHSEWREELDIMSLEEEDEISIDLNKVLKVEVFV